MWYRGKITAYDEETDNYTVFLDTDGETTTFQLPDPDVRVVGLSDNHSDDYDLSKINVYVHMVNFVMTHSHVCIYLFLFDVYIQSTYAHGTTVCS